MIQKKRLKYFKRFRFKYCKDIPNLVNQNECLRFIRMNKMYTVHNQHIQTSYMMISPNS